MLEAILVRDIVYKLTSSFEKMTYNKSIVPAKRSNLESPSSMVDSIYRTRSLGVAAAGIPDQYADGKASRVWEAYIGCQQTRTDQYRTWICEKLRASNRHNRS